MIQERRSYGRRSSRTSVQVKSVNAMGKRGAVEETMSENFKKGSGV